jgi:hypothetical protein
MTCRSQCGKERIEDWTEEGRAIVERALSEVFAALGLFVDLRSYSGCTSARQYA